MIGLLDVRARTDDGTVLVTFPDGTSHAVDDPAAATRLSAQVGQPVTFARETSVVHFDDGPVSLIGTASLAALAAERGALVDFGRFRANVLVHTVEPFVEDGSASVARSASGRCVLRVTMTSARCVMVQHEVGRPRGPARQPGRDRRSERHLPRCRGRRGDRRRPDRRGRDHGSASGISLGTARYPRLSANFSRSSTL